MEPDRIEMNQNQIQINSIDRNAQTRNSQLISGDCHRLTAYVQTYWLNPRTGFYSFSVAFVLESSIRAHLVLIIRQACSMSQQDTSQPVNQTRSRIGIDEISDVWSISI